MMPIIEAIFTIFPPLAFIIGFVLYYVLAKAGLEGKTLEMPSAGVVQDSP